jgi:hypothetical protein
LPIHHFHDYFQSFRFVYFPQIVCKITKALLIKVPDQTRKVLADTF